MALYYAFSRIELSQFILILKSIKFLLVIIASLSFIVSINLLALRWHVILRYSKDIPFSTQIKGHFIGYFGNNVFPLRLGEFMRSFFVAKRHDMKFIEVFGTAALERFIDIITITLLFLVLILSGVLSLESSFAKFVILIGIIIATSITVYSLLKVEKIPFLTQKMIHHIKLFLKGIKNLRGFRNVTLVIVVTMLIWISFGLRFLLVLMAFNIKAGVILIILMLVATVIGLSVPAAPGAIGTYHVAVIVALHNVAGYDLTLAQSVAVILHLSSYIPSTLLGFLVFLFNNVKLSEVRKAKRSRSMVDD